MDSQSTSHKRRHFGKVRVIYIECTIIHIHNQTNMMATTLDRDRDTASVVRPRQPTRRTFRQRREMYEDRGVRPAGNDNDMRSPGGKSERGNDGGKGAGSSGNNEETEDGSTVCTGDAVERRQGRKMAEGYNMLYAGGDGIRGPNCVGIIMNVEISKEVVRVERWHGRVIAVWMMIRQ